MARRAKLNMHVSHSKCRYSVVGLTLLIIVAVAAMLSDFTTFISVGNQSEHTIASDDTFSRDCPPKSDVRAEESGTGCPPLPQAFTINTTSNGGTFSVNVPSGIRLHRLSVLDNGSAVLAEVQSVVPCISARGVYVGDRHMLQHLPLPHCGEVSQCALVTTERVACQHCTAGLCRAAVFDARSGERVPLPAAVTQKSGAMAMAAPMPDGEWAVVSAFDLALYGVRSLNETEKSVSMLLAIPWHLERWSVNASLRCVAAESPANDHVALVLVSDAGHSHGVVLVDLIQKRAVGFTTQDLTLPAGVVVTGCQLTREAVSVAFVSDKGGDGGVVHVQRSSLSRTAEVHGAFKSLALLAGHKMGVYETGALARALNDAGYPFTYRDSQRWGPVRGRTLGTRMTALGVVLQVRNLHAATASAYDYHLTRCQEFGSVKLMSVFDGSHHDAESISTMLRSCCNSSLIAWQRKYGSLNSTKRVCQFLHQVPLLQAVSCMAFRETKTAARVVEYLDKLAEAGRTEHALLVRYEDSMSEDAERRQHYARQVAQFAGYGARGEALVRRHVDGNVVKIDMLAVTGQSHHVHRRGKGESEHRWSGLYAELHKSPKGAWQKYVKYSQSIGLWDVNQRLGYSNVLTDVAHVGGVASPGVARVASADALAKILAHVFQKSAP